ncbi:MAG: sulfurtransferase, partial [Verrucomicrobiales bacterium]
MHPSYLESGNNRAKYYPSYEHPADGNLLCDDELVSAIRRLGITPETLVIVYGSEPDGMMAAARLVWALMYAGVESVRLLDGGLSSWLAFGGKTSSLTRPAWDIGRDDAK